MEQIGGPLDLLQNFVGAELDVGQVFAVLRPIAKKLSIKHVLRQITTKKSAFQCFQLFSEKSTFWNDIVFKIHRLQHFTVNITLIFVTFF